ncbi:hypothetical protein [Pyxidicoccus xibeiensis]|uniref:hypothetical protein n=1 Tax=Pyxidicoccus xibeiensis TaxID=2906759 RepID=UPI0020A7AA9F|nr:hypothetical protein [Pyxidicoccus xibeiensis]MCP3143701.1 hypothetical protein [Pyxidicoccus xibeiensis]
MRHLAMACLCLAAAACGGDFSNDDLEFLNALPRREDLAAKLPPSSEGRAGGGLTTRKAALVVKLGEASELASETDETGRNFNAGVDGLLTLLENIRNASPTTREPDRRVWGPFRDDKHRDFEVRFVMERQALRFDYRLEYRRRGEGDLDWWAFLTGHFESDAGIRKGTGAISLDVKRAREEAFETDLEALDRLDIVYQTKALPTRVEMVFTPAGGLVQATRYTYREAEGGVGEMKFQLPGTDLVAGGRLEDVELTSRWAPDGRGAGTLLVLDGDITGAKYTECWNALGRVTFLARSWDFFNPTEGNRSTCPDFSALDE